MYFLRLGVRSAFFTFLSRELSWPVMTPYESRKEGQLRCGSFSSLAMSPPIEPLTSWMRWASTSVASSSCFCSRSAATEGLAVPPPWAGWDIIWAARRCRNVNQVNKPVLIEAIRFVLRSLVPAPRAYPTPSMAPTTLEAATVADLEDEKFGKRQQGARPVLFKPQGQCQEGGKSCTRLFPNVEASTKGKGKSFVKRKLERLSVLKEEKRPRQISFEAACVASLHQQQHHLHKMPTHQNSRTYANVTAPLLIAAAKTTTRQSLTETLDDIKAALDLLTSQRSPSDPMDMSTETERMDSIHMEMGMATNMSKSVVIAGDINLDLHRIKDASYTKRSLLLKHLQFLESVGLEHAITGPTFRSYGCFHMSCLDHVYTNRTLDTCKAQSEEEESQDLSGTQTNGGSKSLVGIPIMFSDILLFALNVLLTLTLVFIIIYFLITLSDLECDYLNAQECCGKLNFWNVPKLWLQLTILFMLLLFGHWMLFLFNLPVCLYLAKSRSNPVMAKRTPANIAAVMNMIEEDRRVDIDTIAAKLDLCFGTVHIIFRKDLNYSKTALPAFAKSTANFRLLMITIHWRHLVDAQSEPMITRLRLDVGQFAPANVIFQSLLMIIAIEQQYCESQSHQLENDANEDWPEISEEQFHPEDRCAGIKCIFIG
eukprot:maker-scaffold612_size124412-snap-gene-0.21 protein:Tk03319 transcript:maker-scaffold612_size124412-snap-gene-0.21-mRNA-1 annotation:"AGAP009116-PA"